MHGILDFSVKKSLMQRQVTAGKNENYFEYHQGHNCGICSSVCPYGRKVLGRQAR